MYRDYFFKAGAYFPFFSLMASGGFKNGVFKKMGKNTKKSLTFADESGKFVIISKRLLARCAH
jgi:hypothetical protein